MRIMFAFIDPLPGSLSEPDAGAVHLAGTNESPALRVATACGQVRCFPDWTGQGTRPNDAPVCEWCLRQSIGEALAVIEAGLAR